MEEYVEVLDISLVTTTPGLTLQHTVRMHEGDALVEDERGRLCIQFGPRKIMAGNEERTLAGKRVTLNDVHIVETTIVPRMELKERPSAKALIDKQRADIEALAKKHGIKSKKE